MDSKIQTKRLGKARTQTKNSKDRRVLPVALPRFFLPKESASYKKKQSFKQMTTRIHIPEKYTLEIRINGVLKSKVDFQIVS